jgi:1-pyrroline-5-carboxylate dehydrogenase
MHNAIATPPTALNEPILGYAPGSPERAQLKAALQYLRKREVDLPMIINGQEVRTDDKIRLSPPHDHQHTLGHAHRGTAAHVQQAVDAALAAKPAWEALSWEQRASIFLKAAELIAGPYRARMNAATILAQSKTVYQSEIDAVCELIDFLRFNVQYLRELYAWQPASSPGVWNRTEWRPLEGFVFAITPFNFTAISGNLPTAPALMGNTVVWKPADSQIYSAALVMEVLREAGLPDGVINLVFVEGPAAGEVIFAHPEFAGLHFTGSTTVFKQLWKTIAQNLDIYRSYPRIVGETGGKDFIWAHPTARAQEVATAITRGAFEFQGQKCSAASRAYLPASLCEDIIDRVKRDLQDMKIGSPEDLGNFYTAVIDERAFDRIVGYIERAKADPHVRVISGGKYDKTDGYFIEPTILLSDTPDSETMREEIFGPVITLYRYADADWETVLDLVDRTSPYALTGAIFGRDRYALHQAQQRLRHAAGNFYINDKPTGAVVNQQPFGGARGSGTNDKAGSILNLLRWTSARTIKETFVPATDYRYPFLQAEE